MKIKLYFVSISFSSAANWGHVSGNSVLQKTTKIFARSLKSENTLLMPDYKSHINDKQTLLSQNENNM